MWGSPSRVDGFSSDQPIVIDDDDDDDDDDSEDDFFSPKLEDIVANEAPYHHSEQGQSAEVVEISDNDSSDGESDDLMIQEGSGTWVAIGSSKNSASRLSPSLVIPDLGELDDLIEIRVPEDDELVWNDEEITAMIFDHLGGYNVQSGE